MKLVFDIDDTILFSIVKEDGCYKFKDENREVINKLNELYHSGHEIILWTGRHWNHLKDTVKQLKDHGVNYHSLVMGKPYADIYIEDKSLRPSEFLKMEI